MGRTTVKPAAGNAANAAGELLRRIEPRMAEIIATIRAMVELESPSFNKAAVDRLGQWVARELDGRGGAVRFHRAATFGDHLQADFAAASSSRDRILLLGHMDTVWEAGTLATMPFRQDGDKLCGPGVLDMKSGIAQMIFAVEALRGADGLLPRPVTILLVSDEEVGSESSRSVTESIARDCAAVLVVEPSFGPRGALKTARKGVGEYTVKVTGRAAHAGLDFAKGHNAVVELARQITRIARFTELRRGITVNPGVIRGGTRSNVVPAEAEALVDVRVSRMADAPRLDKKFRSLRPFDRRCGLQVGGGVNRPPLERTAKVAALFRAARALGREMDLRLEEAAVGGGSDGNFTAALGVPTLDGLGAVGDGAHASHEFVLLSQLAPRTALLARLVETL